MRTALAPLLTLLLTLAWLTLTSAAAADPPARVDFSGLDLFWSVAETLQRDEMPADARWQALLETPGYAQLVRYEGADRALRKLLPLALMPSQAAERAETIAGGGVGMLVDHYVRAVAERQDLGTFRRHLAKRDLKNDAFALAMAWLPKGTVRDPKAPEISFVIFKPDANGYERVVIDLLVARGLGVDLTVLLLAHEVHHVLRGAVKVVRLGDADLPERDLLHALDNLQAEGIADHIDKPSFFARKDWGEDPTAGLFAGLMTKLIAAGERADEDIARMDRLLVSYLEDPASAPTVGRELRQVLIMGGHPVGFHMASTIVEAFGRRRLIEHFADPFVFLADYNEASVKLGGRHVLGDGAMAAVERLRQLVSTDPNTRRPTSKPAP